MFNSKKIKKLQDDAERYRKLYFNLMEQIGGFARSIEVLREENSKLKKELCLMEEKYFDVLNKNIEILEIVRSASGGAEDIKRSDNQ